MYLKLLEIKSVRTVIDYCDYLRESYLVDFIPYYSPSLKKQLANLKRVFVLKVWGPGTRGFRLGSRVLVSGRMEDLRIGRMGIESGYHQAVIYYHKK